MIVRAIPSRHDAPVIPPLAATVPPDDGRNLLQFIPEELLKKILSLCDLPSPCAFNAHLFSRLHRALLHNSSSLWLLKRLMEPPRLDLDWAMTAACLHGYLAKIACAATQLPRAMLSALPLPASQPSPRLSRCGYHGSGSQCHFCQTWWCKAWQAHLALSRQCAAQEEPVASAL